MSNAVENTPKLSTDDYVSDPIYSDLEPIGKGGPKLALFTQNMGTESSTARIRYIQWLDQSRSLYNFGREDGAIGDIRPTINRIAVALNTFTSMATRTDAGIVIKSTSANEDGKWYLKKPYTLPEHEGMPPLPLPFLQKGPDGKIIPLDEAAFEKVPADHRVCIDTETCVKWAQKNFDIKARECRMFDVIRNIIHRKQQDGWVMGLYQWDAIRQGSIFSLYEPQCWLPDDIVEDIADMAFLRLDVPTDANYAKRLHPDLSAFIDRRASRMVALQPGNTALPSKYFDRVWARPMIVLCYCWLRNQQAPMTMQEGLETGMLAWQEANSEQPTDATGPADEAEPSTEGDASGIPEGGGPEEQDESASQDGGISLPPDQVGGGSVASVGPQLVHTGTGEDMTSSFDLATGEPAPHPDTGLLHPNHPHKIVTRQYIMFENDIIPGSDVICPHWDMPSFSDRNIPVIGTPFGLPETLRLASPQRTINASHAAQVNHVAYFKAPGGFMYKDVQEKITPKFNQDGFMNPGIWYTVESTGNPADDDIRKKILMIDPPSMPPAIPALNIQVSKDFDIVAGGADVDRGIPPSPGASGTQVQALQAASNASQGFKSQFSEQCIWRMSMLKLHAEIHWMSIAELKKINRSIPLPLVIDAVLPFLRSIVLDVEVSLPTGAGQIKMQHDAQIRQDFAVAGGDGHPLIDAETARDELDYDSEEIERRLEAQQEKMMQVQQANAPAPPAPPPPPDNSPKLSIAIDFSQLVPDVQSQLLQAGGINVSPGSAVTIPAEKPTITEGDSKSTDEQFG